MTVEPGLVTTTPYAEGSATLVTWGVSRKLSLHSEDYTHHNGTLGAVRQVEVTAQLAVCPLHAPRSSPEGLEGVRASDVRVKDEEWRVVLAEDVTGKGEGAGWRVSTSQVADLRETHQCPKAQSRRRS